MDRDVEQLVADGARLAGAAAAEPRLGDGAHRLEEPGLVFGEEVEVSAPRDGAGPVRHPGPPVPGERAGEPRGGSGAEARQHAVAGVGEVQHQLPDRVAPGAGAPARLGGGNGAHGLEQGGAVPGGTAVDVAQGPTDEPAGGVHGEGGQGSGVRSEE